MLILLVDLCTLCHSYGCESFVGFIASIFKIQGSRKVVCCSLAGRKSRVSCFEPAYTKKSFLPYLTWTLKINEVISKRRQNISLPRGASNDGSALIMTSCNVVKLSLCSTKHKTNKAYKGIAIDPITKLIITFI